MGKRPISSDRSLIEMPAVISRLRVRYAETDQMGVAYHANYLVWMEVGRTDYCRACGFTYRDMEAAGVRLVVAEARVRYHAAARYDDALRIETRLTTLRSRQVGFAYTVHREDDETLLATGDTLHLPTDAHGRVIRLPSNIYDALLHAPHADKAPLQNACPKVM
ncbi:MAG: acyl-CoA thioesterase [Chloracidobacterium sp.]|nr:acyl-CoA thioesterase [Chloracidobacterium sp.]MDW8216452.1 thioesterase family protein [Acidobacteriota bacterium]